MSTYQTKDESEECIEMLLDVVYHLERDFMLKKDALSMLSDIAFCIEHDYKKEILLEKIKDLKNHILYHKAKVLTKEEQK